MVPASPPAPRQHCYGPRHWEGRNLLGNAPPMGWVPLSAFSHADLRLATSQRGLRSLVSVTLGVTSSHLPDAPSEQLFC